MYDLYILIILYVKQYLETIKNQQTVTRDYPFRISNVAS